MNDRESVFQCRLHGTAYVTGCPGCTTAADNAEDAYDVKVVKARMRWWKLPNLCRRMGHFWREMDEPGAFKCLICRSILFSEKAGPEALYHVLGGHSSTCSYWVSTMTANTVCSCGRQT
jgi:hypothetical protein